MPIDKDQKILFDFWSTRAKAAKLAAEKTKLTLERLAVKTALLAERRRAGETVFDPKFRADVAALQDEARQIPLRGPELALGCYQEAVHLRPSPAFQTAREAIQQDIQKAESSLGTVRFLIQAQGEAAGFGEARESIAQLCAVYEIKP